MKHLLSNHNATTLGPLFDKCGVSPCTLTGQQLKEKGLKLVRENNENWMEDCVNLCINLVTWNASWPKDFTGEDIRFRCALHYGQPRHPNAWGALINTLIKRKIIVPTGEYRPMKDRTSHARSTPVYKAV